MKTSEMVVYCVVTQSYLLGRWSLVAEHDW